MTCTVKRIRIGLFALLIACLMMCLQAAPAFAAETDELVVQDGVEAIDDEDVETLEGGESAQSDDDPKAPKIVKAADAPATEADDDADVDVEDAAEGEVVDEASSTDADETEEESLEEADAATDLVVAADMVAQGDPRPTAVVKVDAHVQMKGWLGEKAITEKETLIGTTGSALRLEALKFSVSGIAGTIQCQAHVQGIGWQDVMDAGKIAGTSGQAKRIEAIRLALTGELSQWYDLSYQAHVQSKGWMKWVSAGEVAGTTGQALRLEALNIKLVPKDAKSAEAGDGIVGVRASAHVQRIGWQAYADSGATVGTTGQSLRMEALRVSLDAGSLGGGVQVNAHVQKKGWMGYQANSAGTTGQGLRMEAVQLKLTGNIESSYDIMYRAHVQSVGWQPWVLNGGTAGTEGRSLRVEALQVKLVKKGTNQSVAEGTYFLTLASNANTALASSGGSGAQATSATYSNASQGERYYVRKENGGVTIQSVATGMFLEASGSNVVQRAYSATNPAQVWNLTWNGGFAVSNKSLAKPLSLSNGKAVTTGSDKWVFTGTSLIGDGAYVVKNAAAGEVLDVRRASWLSGANIMAYDSNGGGNQAFTFTHTGSDVYKINNAMTGKAVEVAGGSTSNGANVRQYFANGSNAQLWKASMDRAGKITFTNRASGKVMTVEGSGGAGSNVCSSADTGANTQRWTLTASSYKPDTVLQRAVSIAEGLSSNTSYFIAVDLSNHRVVVLQGSRNNWEVIQNWVATTGAPSSPTVLGDYTVTGRGYSFGHGYTCYYWTQFYGNYLFHSVLYNEGTRTIQDGRLGYALSAGCVRLDINNAKWIYDNIPNGTHVKTYY
ncbi:MAG: RICIN domain-containing protein [Eggerthellaceae bacterium]|nr:RICIN domain-containing protein [Eggerthellaceae bacterium]